MVAIIDLRYNCVLLDSNVLSCMMRIASRIQYNKATLIEFLICFYTLNKLPFL
jgi:hypothetical protein